MCTNDRGRCGDEEGDAILAKTTSGRATRVDEEGGSIGRAPVVASPALNKGAAMVDDNTITDLA